MASMLFMAVIHTQAKMLKHKTYRVLQAKTKATLEIMHDPKYTEMPNATHAKCNYSRLDNSRHGIWNATTIMYSIWN